MKKTANIFLIVAALIVFLIATTLIIPRIFFRGQRFVSEDGAQTLELQVTSQLRSVIPAVAGAISGGRLLGKRHGRYTLTTPQGQSSGEFAWLKGPLCCKELPDQTLVFWPDNGKEWSVAVQGDRSFVDSAGMTWRLKSPE